MADAERAGKSPTDLDDLESALHNSGSGAPVEEEMEGEQDFGDVPQEYTESYGTGVQELPGYNIGGRTMRDRAHESNASPVLTGGDIDANYEQAEAVGDEAVGGTVSTPGKSIVDDLGKAVGLEMDDQAFLRTTEILEQRDDHRWELEPTSSEDYSDRQMELDEIMSSQTDEDTEV